jgi:hypothetical protein
METMTFIVACSKFFGRLPGQSLVEFRDELAALSDLDRAELIAWFRTVGIDATRAS